MKCTVLCRAVATAALWGAVSSQVGAQPTPPPTVVTGPNVWFVEANAGRALRRIIFANFDENPAFAQVFQNGSYEDVRGQFCLDPRLCRSEDASSFLLNRIISQSQTFPNASSANGFTFTWGAGATPTLESEIFGPLFGERGLTNGRQQLSVTVSYQRLAWRSLDGSRIRNDQRGLDWGDFNYDGLGSSYVGRCRMNITSDMAMLGLNYGLTNRLDMRATFPFVFTSVVGSNEFLDFQVDDQGNVVAFGVETGFTPQGRYYVRGESAGIGDIDVTFKYSFLKRGSNAMALTFGARLGTGSFDKMTGTGETSGLFSLVTSLESHGISPHFQVGLLLAGPTLYHEVDTTLGLSVRAIRNRLTITGEFVGRRLFDVRGFVPERVFQAGVSSPASPESYDLRRFVAARGNLALRFITAGVKLRLFGQLLVTGSALWPRGGQGLETQRPSWSFGLNYAL